MFYCSHVMQLKFPAGLLTMRFLNTTTCCFDYGADNAQIIHQIVFNWKQNFTRTVSFILDSCGYQAFKNELDSFDSFLFQVTMVLM